MPNPSLPHTPDPDLHPLGEAHSDPNPRPKPPPFQDPDRLAFQDPDLHTECTAHQVAYEPPQQSPVSGQGSDDGCRNRGLAWERIGSRDANALSSPSLLHAYRVITKLAVMLTLT